MKLPLTQQSTPISALSPFLLALSKIAQVLLDPLASVKATDMNNPYFDAFGIVLLCSLIIV